MSIFGQRRVVNMEQVTRPVKFGTNGLYDFPGGRNRLNTSRKVIAVTNFGDMDSCGIQGRRRRMPGNYKWFSLPGEGRQLLL